MIYYPNIFIQLVFGKMASTLICTASGFAGDPLLEV